MAQTKVGSGFVATGAVGPTSLSTGAPYWDTSGNVGIGTSSPSTYGKFTVYTASATDTVAAIANTAGNGWLGYLTSGGDMLLGLQTSGTLNFRTGNTTRLQIDSSGNVGIGTSSPAGRLDVVSTSAGGASFMRVVNTSGSANSYAAISLDPGNNGLSVRDAQLRAINNGFNAISLSFLTSNGAPPVEAMRIDSTGNLLVGTSSALSNTAKVQISGGSGSTITSETSGTGATDHVNFRNGNGKVGTITTSGTATSYNTSSDYRLKHSVAPMTTGLATVTALKPVTYKWNADDSNGEGFIAHELQEVIPLAVTGEKDAVDEEGNIKPQGVDYSKIVVHLVAAIQELTAKVTALEAKVGS